MEFDKSKVYTAVDADALRVGDKVIVAHDLYFLKRCVKNNSPIDTIQMIRSEDSMFRFNVKENVAAFSLAYLIEKAHNCTNCEGCTDYIKPDKTFGCIGWKPKTNRNLCDSCKQCFAECPATPDDIIFGDGVGNDNVYACDKYEKKAEPHYRPFKDTEELVKVWEQKWSEKTNGQKWHDCKLNMPYIWVQRKESNSKGQLITEFSDEIHVGIGRGEAYNMTDLWVYFTFLDGSPCGVEE